MSLSSLYAAFAEHLQSPQFHAQARHADHPNAFCRERKLPLPSLLAAMLGGMRKSVRAELGEFFGHLEQQAQLVHHVSERAFSRARAKLAATAIPALNDWLVARADGAGFVPRWHGLRLVAADASTLRFGLRASTVANPASADQIAFGLFLPGAEMMLAASLHSVRGGLQAPQAPPQPGACHRAVPVGGTAELRRHPNPAPSSRSHTGRRRRSHAEVRFCSVRWIGAAPAAAAGRQVA